jgi:hypothetical protein
MTFDSPEPDPDDESNYSEVIHYGQMSLESMDDVSTYFELTRHQERRLQSALDDWLETDRRVRIAALLKFDEYFEVGQYLDLYTEEDSELAEDDFNEGDKNKNYNLVFDDLMEDDENYERYVGDLPEESGFFHDEYRSDPERFHDEIGCGVNNAYIEREWNPPEDGDSGPNYDELYGVLGHYGIHTSLWEIMPDGSLGEDGVEIISPPIDISKIEDSILKIKEFAEHEGFHTSEKCGLHINVSVPNFFLPELDYLKLCLLVGDQHVLEKFGRETNIYCKSSLNKINTGLFSNKDGLETKKILLDHLHTTLGKQAAIRFRVLTSLVANIEEKYSSIGIKNNRIEFRSVGGDWLSGDINDVLEMVYRFTYCLYAACNPEVEKKEYAKKLYKFLQAHTEDKTSPMLSSLVISGVMTPKEAIAKIKSKSSEQPSV